MPNTPIGTHYECQHCGQRFAIDAAHGCVPPQDARDATTPPSFDAEVARVRRGTSSEDTERDWKKLHFWGLYEEVGEVVSLVRKSERGGRTVDRFRLTDELGDVCCYLALIAQDLGFTFTTLAASDPYQGTHPDALDNLVELLGEVASARGLPAQTKNRAHNIFYALRRLFGGVRRFAGEHGITLEEAQRANITKLRARFGAEGYTIAAAEAKADEVKGTSDGT